MYEFGLVSISFRKLSPEEIIKGCAEAGLDCIEWGSDIHAPCTDLDRVREIARMQQEAGLHCSSYGTYFKLGRDSNDELPAYIEAAKILGTRLLRVWAGVKGSADYTPEELEDLYAQCREAAAIAEANGVILCMESHNGTVTDTKESALALMQAVESPAFQIFYQINQIRSDEENVRFAQMLAPYTRHIHVFQWDKDDHRFPLSEGKEIWRRYLSCIPRDQDRALLLEFIPDNRIESVKTEAASLREIASGI